jgi:filamentous hemagglutinin family protein
VPLRGWFTVVGACVLAALAPPPASAQHITIDGRLSPPQTLVGPNYTIGANLGKQVGSNLFHSFGQFSLSNAPVPESATFTSTGNTGPISNVIGRVTGGSQSNINGAIVSAIPGANLYLINPSGIVFGPHATVNVSGSFHASTADYLKMSDGAKFQATNPDGSTLSAAPPVAFGFMTASPPAITVNGSTLGVPSGQTLGLIGGGTPASPTAINGATLTAPAGTIDVTSVAGTGEVPIDPRNKSALTVSSFGPVAVTSGSTLNVSDPVNLSSGGSVFIRSGALSIDASEINADNYGSGQGGTLFLRGDGQLALSDSAYVHSFAQASGSGAAVILRSATGGTLSAENSIVAVGSNGAGNSGKLVVSGGQISLTNGAQLTSTVQSTGNGGAIAIKANNLVIDGGATNVTSTTVGAGLTDTNGNPVMAGAGGAITVTAQNLAIQNGAGISATTSGDAPGGAIGITLTGTLAITSASSLTTAASGNGAGGATAITAGIISIDGDPSQNASSGIFATSSGNGTAGSITIAAGSVSITGFSEIGSTTTGPGNSANVSLSVTGALLIDAGTVPNLHGVAIDDPFVGIRSASKLGSAGGTGAVTASAGSVALNNGAEIGTGTSSASPAGDVTIAVAGMLSINGGFIGADTMAAGAAGSILVTGHDITITGGGSIKAETETGSLGPGGSVTVNVLGDLVLDSLSSIDADGFGSGKTGVVSVYGQNITLRGGAFISSTQAETAAAAAGEVTITAAHNLLLESRDFANPSEIDADNFGSGTAGVVRVSGENITLRGNTYISAAQMGGPGAAGGDVTVTAADSLLLDSIGANLSEINTNNFGSGTAGAVTVSGRNITLSGGSFITSEANRLNTADRGNAGSVTVTASENLLVDGTGSLSPRPTLISSDTHAGAGGSVKVSAPNIELRAGGVIASDARAGSTGNAGDVTIQSTNLSLVDGGTISSTALGPSGQLPASTGNAGRVTVNVTGLLSMSGPGSQIATNTEPGTTGNAGLVAVTAPRITIASGAQIVSTTAGTGAGGSVMVTTPGMLALDGAGVANTQIAASATGPQSGPGGFVTVVANSLMVEGGARIASSTAGPGNGGSVQVSAQGPLLVSSPGSSITASALSSGMAGSVALSAPQITLVAGGAITSTTAGTGAGGSVAVTTPGALVLDGMGVSGTQIAASAMGAQSGPGGPVTVAAHDLAIAGGAQIASTTAGPGAAGDIGVAVVNDVTLAGQGPSGASAITASARPGSSGRAGKVGLTAGGAITLSSGAQIASSSEGTGGGGNVQVAAQGPLRLSDPGTGIIAPAGSTVSANAGSVTVNAPQITLSTGAEISSINQGTGGVGSVSVMTPGALVLDGEGIANTRIAASATGAQSGAGGVVTVQAGSLTVEGGAQIASTAGGLGKGGDVGVTIAGNVSLSGVTADGSAASGISAEATQGSVGGAGQVTLAAGGALRVSGGAEISSSTKGQGNGGSV